MAKFTTETARAAGQKSKRGNARIDPTVSDAVEILFTEGMTRLYEKMDELNPSQLLKLVQIMANYVLPKAKPQRDRWSQEYFDAPYGQYRNKTEFFEEERNRK